MRLTWDHSKPLAWFEVFVNTIKAMPKTTRLPWNGLFSGTLEDVTALDFDSLIQIRRIRENLQVKHAVSALYETGLAMAATSAKDHLFAGIVVNDRPIGFLLYGIKRSQLGDGALNGTNLLGGNHATQNISTSPSELSTNSSALATRRSGTVKDPGDPKFEIDYEFQGTPVSNGAVFAAFVDATATAAQYDDELPGGELAALSPDDTVSIIMRRDKDTATFTWRIVKSALAVIWRQIIIRYLPGPDPVWEDLDFLIYYDGSRIGEGFIVSYERLDPPSDTAVAN